MSGKSELVVETRVMRSIATQLDKLSTDESRSRVLTFVNSVVNEKLASLPQPQAAQ